MVANDGTMSFAGQRRQLHPLPHRTSLARAVVDVREHLDGSLSVWHQAQPVMTTAPPVDAPQLRARGGPRTVSSESSLAHGVDRQADIVPEQLAVIVTRPSAE